MKRLRTGGAIAFVLVAVAVFAFAVGRPIQVLPRVAAAPPFELMDPWGVPLLAPLESDRITLYTFGASRNEEGMAEVARVYREIGGALAEAGYGDDVRFVYITVDPDFDTPQVLRQAAEALDADGLPEFTFLTGSWVAIRMAVGAGFGVYFEAAQDGGDAAGAQNAPPAYDPVLIVVDADHTIRARYALGEATPQVLLRDMELLAKEASATGASRLVYEGAHLFLCYPR